MRMNTKNTIIFLLLMLASQIFGQVTISPISLFIDSQRRFETLLIMNTSDVAQEVKLSWEFGYPKANEAGDIAVLYGDEKEAALHSAADWIRGFPKNFILEPGQRQTVRITVKAPRNLPAGTYWSRLKTSSSALSTAIGEAEPGGITTKINIQFNQVTSIFYKHGELSTGLQITGIRNVVDDQTVHVFADYKKSGNSPFLGTMTAKVTDAVGEIVKEGKVLISVYYDGLRRLDLDVSDLPLGSYDVEVSISSGRSDIPDADIIPAPTVTDRSTFTKL